MRRGFTRPIRVIGDAPIKASHQNTNARCIEELQAIIKTPPRSVQRPTASSCPFGRAQAGSTSSTRTLSEGQIHAAGTHTAEGGSEGTELTPVDGHFVWAEVTITATVDSGMLTGEWAATDAELASGEEVPDDHTWTAEDASGKAYAPLGVWSETSEDVFSFSAYGCGDVTFLWCASTGNSGSANFYRG